MSEMKLFEEIEDYLLDRLSGEARQAFEAKMAADPALRAEVALHRDMMHAIEAHEEPDVDEPPSKDLLDLRKLMVNAYQETQQEGQTVPDLPNPPSGKRWLRYLLVAAALPLAALGYWWIQHPVDSEIGKQTPAPTDSVQMQTPVQQQEPIAQTTPTPADTPPNAFPPAKQYAALAQKAYSESPFDVGTLMGEGDEPDESPLQKAGEAYAKKQYLETASLLQTLPEEGRTDALKLRAHAQFRLGRYDRAAADFQELTKSVSYRYDAEWYLLLCHAARLPKTKAAYEALRAKIIKPGHPFEARARKLTIDN